MAVLLNSVSVPTTSSSANTGVPGDLMFTFRGTIGDGVVDVEISNDNTNWIRTGAVFDSSDITPKIVTFATGQYYRARVSGRNFSSVLVEAV